MSVLVILFSILLAVCTAVKPIWLQDTVDACTNGGTGLLLVYRRVCRHRGI